MSVSRLKPNSSFHQSHHLPFILPKHFPISPLQFWETLCCWLSSDPDFCRLPSSPRWSHTTSRRIWACWLFSGSPSGSRWYDDVSQDSSHQLDFFFFFYQSWYCLCGNAREVTESTASCASSVLHADWPSITKPPTDQWSKWHCSYILCCGAINHFEKIYQIKFMPITNLAFFKTLQAGHKCVLFLMFELSKPSLILRLFFLYTAFFFFFFTRTWNEVVTSGQQVHLSPAGSVCYSSGKCVTQW